MEIWKVNYIYAVVVICWLCLFSGFCLFAYNKSIAVFPNSWLSSHNFCEAAYDTNSTAKSVLAKAARKLCVVTNPILLAIIWDLTLPHTILSVRLPLQMIREMNFTWFPALKGAVCSGGMVWFCWNGVRCWTFPRVPSVEPASSVRHCGACNSLLEAVWCQGSQACKLLWTWGSWHHRICGSGAGCQATKPPFFFWKQHRILNTQILH